MADLTLVPPTNGNGNDPNGPLRPSPPAPTSRINRIELSKRDLSIIALHKLGLDEEAIVHRLKLDTLRVQASLLKFYRRQAAANHEMMQIGVNEMGLDRLAEVNAAIADGLTATKPVKNEKGEVTGWVPDRVERREMARLLKEWIAVVMPKTPLISQNINQNNQQNNYLSGRGLSFESRLREKREARGLLNDANVVDAEVVEDDELEDEEETEGSEDVDETEGSETDE